MGCSLQDAYVDTMIGVTIGIGETHYKLALAAAKCLKKRTGLNTYIVTDKDFSKSGLSHPAAMKFKIFELCKYENILYYDADWFCLNNWDPVKFCNSANIIACHDFVLEKDWPNQKYKMDSVEFNGSQRNIFIKNIEGKPRLNYIHEVKSFIDLNLHYKKWINTGMFIVNKNNHEEWLKVGESIYLKPNNHHLKYFEQPSLLKSLQLLKLNVNYLPRKFNILVFEEIKWNPNIVALHLKIKYLPKLINYIQHNNVNDISIEYIENMFIKEI